MKQLTTILDVWILQFQTNLSWPVINFCNNSPALNLQNLIIPLLTVPRDCLLRLMNDEVDGKCGAVSGSGGGHLSVVGHGVGGGGGGWGTFDSINSGLFGTGVCEKILGI